MNRRSVKRGSGKHRRTAAAETRASGRHRKQSAEVHQSTLTSPTRRPTSRRRHETPRTGSHPRFAAAVALAGITAVAAASLAASPSDSAGRVELSATRSEVSPDVLLAAVIQTFFGPVTILPTTTPVDPAVFSAAIAALVDGHTNTVNTQMAGPNALNIPLWVLPGSTART